MGDGDNRVPLVTRRKQGDTLDTVAISHGCAPEHGPGTPARFRDEATGANAILTAENDSFFAAVHHTGKRADLLAGCPEPVSSLGRRVRSSEDTMQGEIGQLNCAAVAFAVRDFVHCTVGT